MKKPGPDHAAVSRLATKVLAAADWRELGDIYFHEDGAAEWRARTPAVVAAGERLARVLRKHVRRGGRSLWVGAGVAELPVLLAEVLLHDRRVVAANLRTRECELLNAALASAAPEVELRYVAGDAATIDPACTFDHLGCISVFTDPETWPSLAGVAYGRIAPVQLDLAQFATEREEARTLARALFARLARPAVVTTSADEVAWFLEQAAAAGVAVAAEDEMIETAVVGDPVGFLKLT